MNSSKSKKINKHSKSILVEWLRENVSEKEAALVNTTNIDKFLPQEKYIFYNSRINLNAYTIRWVKQILKKMVKNGFKLENISMDKVEKYINED